MSKLGRPRGLIDYESWKNIERGLRNEAPVNRLVRPKTIGLTAACLALAGTIGVAFATKTNATLSVEHDRDPVAVRLSDGSVRNTYTVKLLNQVVGPPRLHTFGQRRGRQNGHHRQRGHGANKGPPTPHRRCGSL